MCNGEPMLPFPQITSLHQKYTHHVHDDVEENLYITTIPPRFGNIHISPRLRILGFDQRSLGGCDGLYLSLQLYMPKFLWIRQKSKTCSHSLCEGVSFFHVFVNRGPSTLSWCIYWEKKMYNVLCQALQKGQIMTVSLLSMNDGIARSSFPCQETNVFL